MMNDILTQNPSTAAPTPRSLSPASSHVTPGATNSVLLEEAYDAYCRLQETGIAFDQSAFVRGYAPIQSSLGRLIELHLLAEEESQREVAEIDWTKIGAWLRGNYDIECDLGEGKFSRVFLATQPKLGHRRVALKVTWEGDAEAYTIGRINHPNVISAYGVETLADQGLSVICMPYEGSATLCSLLDRVMASHVPPPSAAVIYEAARDFHARASTPVPESATKLSFEQGVRALFAQICDALEALHAQDILHRDLKPSNILFRPDGSPVLLDFNLARDAKAPSGRFGGTFPYMPPEQLRAMAGVTAALTQKLDARSDIYSVGALLWETLTGKKPFGDTLHAQIAADCMRELSARQQAGFTAPMPPQWTVSPELTNIVRRCLAVNPDERPRSAAELRNLLVPPAKRPRRGWIVGAVVATALLAFGAVAFRPSTGPRPPEIGEGRQAAGFRFYQEGLAAARDGDVAAADNAFTRAMLEEPNDPKPHRARAYLAARLPILSASQALRALGDLRRATELDQSPEDKAMKAYFYHVAGDPPMATMYYLQARDAKQGSHALSNNLAQLFTVSKRSDEALAMLDEVVPHLPRMQAPRINRGMARYEKSLASSNPPRTDEEKTRLRDGAIADFTEALRMGPDRGELRYFLAMALAFPEPRNGWETHLARAIDLGFDQKNLTTGIAWANVRNLPRFDQLMTRPAGDVNQWKSARLIPPNPVMPE